MVDGRIRRRVVAAMVGFVLAACTCPLDAGLVGYWTFEGDTQDQFSNNHGTQSGGTPGPAFFSSDTPTVLSGSTQSLNLAGGQYVQIANENNFDLGAAMSISAWVKGSLPGTWEPFISKNGEPSGWQFRRHQGDQTIDWTTRRSPDNGATDFASVGTNVGDGNWHHIAATFDGFRKMIYIDGALNSSVNVGNSPIISNSDPVLFGARYNGGVGATSFNGLMDNVAIYDHMLTASQVAQLAAGGSPEGLDFHGLNYNFGTPGMKGWSVLSGRAVTGDGGGGFGAGMAAANAAGTFAHDPAHPNFLAASPTFVLTGETVDGVNALIVSMAGGKGNQSGLTITDPAQVIGFNGGNTNSSGAKGLAFFNTDTGVYDTVLYTPSDNFSGPQYFTLNDLLGLGVSPNEAYQLHFFDNDDGGWGWTKLNAVEIAAVNVPEPVSLTLLGLAACGLGGYIRRRRS